MPSFNTRFLRWCLIFLAMVPALSASAQYITRNLVETLQRYPVSPIHDSLQPRITQQNFVLGLDTKQSGSRLLGYVWSQPNTADSSLELYDSVSFSYSYGRGGDLTGFNQLKFDTEVIWMPEFSGQWQVTRKICQTFDSLSRLQSTLVIYPSTNGAWINSEKTVITYNNLGQEGYVAYSIWDSNLNRWQRLSQIKTSYDTSGLPLAIITNKWAGDGSYRGADFDSMTYDAQNRIVEYTMGYLYDSLHQQGFIQKGIAYEYDAGGLLKLSYLFYVRGQRIDPVTYYYDTAYRLIAMQQNSVDKDSFAVTNYNAAGQIQSFTWYRFQSQIWEPIIRFSNTYSERGLLQSQLHQWLDGSNHKDQLLYKYNSLGQLTYEDQESEVNGIWGHFTSNDMSLHYVYDVNNTTIHATLIPALQFELTPIPADRHLSFRIGTERPKVVQAAIFSMQGAMVAEWNGLATIDNACTISTSGIPAGNYLFLLHSGDGKTGRRMFNIRH